MRDRARAKSFSHARRDLSIRARIEHIEFKLCVVEERRRAGLPLKSGIKLRNAKAVVYRTIRIERLFEVRPTNQWNNGRHSRVGRYLIRVPPAV